MAELQQGGNAPLAGSRASVVVAWPRSSGSGADVSAYLLGSGGKVRGDADMVFYNQPSGGDGGVRFASEGSRAVFELDLDLLPMEIDRIVLCVTADDAGVGPGSLSRLDGATIEVTASGGGEPIRYRPSLGVAAEAAMMFGEVYRRAGRWKFRAVGQGFNGGLAPLARSFGIDVAEDRLSSTPPPATPARTPVPAAPAPVRLSKVTLEKPGQTVSLEKRGTDFGEITVNLNWSRGRRGFFGGGSAVDLDLGCLFELADGRKGVVQALGNVFGAFAQPPFIALSGDDRTGDVSQGETLRINGAQWSAIRRIAVFANIYDGVPNWQQTDGVVTVTMPDQPPIEVRMTEGRNDRRLCGVVLIENDGGRLKATRLVDYFRDQQLLDRRLAWGLRWTAGSKD